MKTTNQQQGLTTAEAKTQLVHLLDINAANYRPLAFHIHWQSTTQLVLAGVTGLVVVLLAIDNGYVLAQNHAIRQTRSISGIAETGLLVVAALISLWVVLRERRLETMELNERLRKVSEEIQNWDGSYADLVTPPLPTAPTWLTLRDRVWREVPTLFLAASDVVALTDGEETPFESTLVDHSTEISGMEGRKLHSVRETPLDSHLQQIRTYHRCSSRSVLQTQMGVVGRRCVLWIVLPIAGISVCSNAVIYGAMDAGRHRYFSAAVETIVGRTVYTLFPFAAATALWPVLWVLARLFGNARGVVLLDSLQQSKTQYEDTADIDEFDVEAMPPTKEVDAGAWDVLKYMGWLWMRCDFRNLSRSSNLCEALGGSTVVCSVDRKGTIAEPFGVPEQIVVPEADGNGEYAVLDLAQTSVDSSGGGGQIFGQPRATIVDEGWEQHLGSLRTIGLACRLGSRQLPCPMEPHLRTSSASMRKHGRAMSAQETCLCAVSDAIGVGLNDISRLRVTRQATVFAPQLGHKSSCGVTAFVAGPGQLQMMTDGSADAVLSLCGDYFDGQSVRQLDGPTMASFYGLYQNAVQQDLQCVGFAYRPLTVDQKHMPWPEWTGQKSKKASSSIYACLQQGSSAKGVGETSAHLALATRRREGQISYSAQSLARFGDESAFVSDIVHNQIFLGLVTLACEPKEDVCTFIEDLGAAGIRFVYFSPARGRRGKAFAERLGLETDWNTCILLGSQEDDQEGDDEGYEDHAIKARLPRGIDNIRAHLQEVDDIPLQVSLFAESSPQAVHEMMRIFQENGDVACCIGSSMSPANAPVFAAADFPVGIDPLPARCSDQPLWRLNAALACLSCPLVLQHDTSLYVLLQVIRDARRFGASVRLAMALLGASCVAMAVINMVGSLCLLPPVLPGWLVLWTLWVVVPMLAAALLFAPPDAAVMAAMPAKCLPRLAAFGRLSVYAVVRMAPPIFLTLLVFSLCLAPLLHVDISHLVHHVSSVRMLVLTDEQQKGLLTAQIYAAVAFVFHCVCISATLMHRTRICTDLIPFNNYVWMAALVLCLSLTSGLAAAVLGGIGAPVGLVPWYVYVAGLAGPLLLLPLQDLSRLHDQRRWTRQQKLAKLEFKTKLGQHSPL